MSSWHLAQLNIAHLQHPIESEPLADFVANLDRINALAEQSPGFVWRLTNERMTEADHSAFGPDYIVNLSVWDTIEALHDYVYRSAHVEVLRRKSEWFHRMPRAHMVLWWMKRTELPDVALAKSRLQQLQNNGPTEAAFTFRQAYKPPSDS